MSEDPGTGSSSSAPPADPPAGGEAAKIEQRFDKIESEQQRQGTVLEQILAKVGAAPDGSGKTSPDSSTGAPVDIAEQMRQAVRDVGAEQREKDAAAAHDADHKRIRERDQHPEHPPRERRTPMRGRLQRVMFGIDDKPPGSKQ